MLPKSPIERVLILPIELLSVRPHPGIEKGKRNTNVPVSHALCAQKEIQRLNRPNSLGYPSLASNHSHHPIPSIPWVRVSSKKRQSRLIPGPFPWAAGSVPGKANRAVYVKTPVRPSGKQIHWLENPPTRVTRPNPTSRRQKSKREKGDDSARRMWCEMRCR